MDGEDTREEEHTKKLFEDDFINHFEEKQRKYEKILILVENIKCQE
jgi:hypothetical protein